MTTYQTPAVSGAMKTLDGERYYCIDNVDQLPPFFISVVSAFDHWMFVASNGALTAGRVSPDTALLPYVTVDKIYDSVPITGPKTLLRVRSDGDVKLWEPFNPERSSGYRLQRNLYKNWHGNKLIFEEINHDLALVFRYQWASSEEFGFIRSSELESLGTADTAISLIDGLQNLLPADTPRFTQTNSSYLVDAYKWNEVDAETGLACYTLYSAITDRAEPCESLRATTVFALGLEQPRVLLSNKQLDAFRAGERLSDESHTRGIRGAYLLNADIVLEAGAKKSWQLVANTERTQAEVVELQVALADPAQLSAAVAHSIARGSDVLNRIIGAADGLQHTQNENLAAHHYANVLFNVMRGGIFNDQYRVETAAINAHFQHFNKPVAGQLQGLLKQLPASLNYQQFLAQITEHGDSQAHRLALEYLPLTFGRRHGDPSRPWNHFTIKLQDDQQQPLLAYEGNWRDIFQNWEALLLSYPDYIEGVIAKFVNASTIDGYNPYRITEAGIDWEVEDEDDPWSYIGYWGDHQIIYLLKLLELSRQFHPQALPQLLHTQCFSYANVPYRLKSFESMLENAKSTVTYDADLALTIESRVEELGADGKLILDQTGQVYLVTLLEKLLLPLLSKLGNLVVDGGIWLNTQRPEWNDANNALVGQGLSMVTLYYIRRYIHFLQPLMRELDQAGVVSAEVFTWLEETVAALREVQPQLAGGRFTNEQRYALLEQLGQAASRYRETVYRQDGFSGSRQLEIGLVHELLDSALAAVDHSIASNRNEDGLYNAYNLLDIAPGSAAIDTLYPMLEGQVAALSSGAIEAEEAVQLLQTLFASPLYRADQKSFILYPDKPNVGFLQKNRIPAEQLESLSTVQDMLKNTDTTLVVQDARGDFRFNARITNVGQLDQALQSAQAHYPTLGSTAANALRELYESVFGHQSFTGRSGGMFGFEGLGSIYWHMVAKLLLAVQERFMAAKSSACDPTTLQQLGELYYAVREGIGFNKSPAEYGAFPNDPYSHTPAHIGAQQPGMTGQVKEEVITRFNELGVRVANGEVTFDPSLLRGREFTSEEQSFRYLDVAGDWQDLPLPTASLVFTWCQVPVSYHLVDTAQTKLVATRSNAEAYQSSALALPAEHARELFERSGAITCIDIYISADALFSD
ncbi:hypothetical protein [Candidatus Litorirhabdus singularis]|nr:hypothetical protein [Candidatus Litorirhabdus singularis]